MARRRAARSIPRRGRPTSPRGPRGPRGPQSKPAPRGRGRPTPRGRGRPTSPRGRGRPSPRGPQPLRDLRPGGSSRPAPRGRALARRRAGAQKNRATRPTINVADLRRKAGTLPPKNFVNTMPRAPRAGGPQRPQAPLSGIQLAQRNAMQRQMEAAARANMAQGGRGSLLSKAFGPRGAQGPMRAPQRPIPNRNGRMALMNQMQKDIARAQQLRGQQSLRGVFSPDRANPSRNLPPTISMDPRRGTFGRAAKPDIAIPPMAPRPMPTSDYMRQQMPAQQLQRGMGRGPMPRANIGQIQAFRPTFGQQMRSPLPRRRR